MFPSKPAPARTPVTKVETKAAPPTPPVEPSEPPQDLSHTWVVAAEIQVEPRIASIADFRGSFKTAAGQRVDALEVYCKGCRRPYDEVKGEDCAEKVDNRHLIGGDQSTRKKRKIPPPPRGAKIIPGEKIQRRGISAYMAGVSRPR
ncbi:hypothetical protein [Streptomyces albidoflavus]|uniref:hypothetical protein n=1 Tax=Streptomyces albidoflavus TaxID=1886 RepID=UPI002119E83D|nr:hypothetical protein [Streptomyces albidoflavus]